jgi:hypothetical protein
MKNGFTLISAAVVILTLASCAGSSHTSASGSAHTNVNVGGVVGAGVDAGGSTSVHQHHRSY